MLLENLTYRLVKIKSHLFFFKCKLVRHHKGFNSSGFFSNNMIHLTCHLFVQFDYTETVFNNSKCYLECHQINWRLFLIDTCRFISSLIGFTGVFFVQKYCLLFSLHLLNYESKIMYIVFILKCALFFMSLYKIFPLYFFLI